jgi:Tol biopolymer transport system component
VHAPFTKIAPISELNTPDMDGWPQLTQDELTMVFASRRTDGLGDIFETKRSTRADPWGAPRRLEVSSASTDGDPALSPDGLIIVFGSNRPGGPGGGSDLWVATRKTLGDPFGPPTAIPGVNSAFDEGDPYPSNDLTELWFSRTSATNVHIYRSRGSLGGGLSAPELVPELAGEAADEQDMALSADGLIMYFTSNRSGSYAIWLTQRATKNDPFTPPTLVSELASGTVDAPNWLSPDNCRLYMWTGRDGSFDIYLAQRSP